MPFNGSNGTFNRLYSWTADAAANINILASRMDAEMNGFAAGLSNCVTRDGQSPPTTDLPMGGKKFTNLGAPTTAGDAATKAYVDGFMPIIGGTFAGPVNFGDANFFRALQGTNALDSWDSNDFSFYDRPNNAYSWNIGGIQEMRLDASNLILPSNGLVLQGGNIAFSNVHTAERSVQFTRASAAAYMYGSGAAIGVFDTALGSIWQYNFADQSFLIKGQTAWHAGNLTNLNQLANGPGYITGINSGMVTGALGYTPYNSSNPAGYISGISGGMVTGALGFTPVQQGGGAGQGSNKIYLGWDGSNVRVQVDASDIGGLARLSGAAFGGDISAPTVTASSDGAGTNFKVGNDVWIGDINVANTMSVRGIADASSGYMRFGSSGASLGVASGSDIGVFNGNFRIDDGRAIILGPDTYIVRSGGNKIAFVVNGTIVFTMGSDGTTRQTGPALWRQGSV